MPTPSLSGDEDDEDEQPDAETKTDGGEDVADEVVDGVEDALDGEDESDEADEQDDEEAEEVAEAQMPEDDEDTETGESGGVLSGINTKAVIVAAAVVVGAVAILWLIRSSGPTSPGQASAEPATDEDLQGDAAGEEQYDISAPDNQPLQQDQQMMGALGMGS